MYLLNKTTAMTITAKVIPAAAAPPTMVGKLSPVSNNEMITGDFARLVNSSLVRIRNPIITFYYFHLHIITQQ